MEIEKEEFKSEEIDEEEDTPKKFQGLGFVGLPDETADKFIQRQIGDYDLVLEDKEMLEILENISQLNLYSKQGLKQAFKISKNIKIERKNKNQEEQPVFSPTICSLIPSYDSEKIYIVSRGYKSIKIFTTTNSKF